MSDFEFYLPYIPDSGDTLHNSFKNKSGFQVTLRNNDYNYIYSFALISHNKKVSHIMINNDLSEAGICFCYLTRLVLIEKNLFNNRTSFMESEVYI